MKKIFTLLLGVALGITSLNAQRVCGSVEYNLQQEQENPTIIQRRQDIEQFTNDFVTRNDGGERALVTIPVVVHVVWNTTAENISDAQIQSQINVLNADFRKLNSDVSGVPSAFAGLAADANIEFCLATVSPTGAATTGINRVQTSQTSFGTNDQVKSASTGGTPAWPSGQYLNLWVCDISGSILGYAQFPGGSAATDGVVVDYQYFGTIGTATAPFNKGRTATHEVGHWLNLRHIWGDDGTGCTGSDLVSDTPNCAGPNYGCPTFPKVTCSNGSNGDMFMNYMDYTDDACMYMFSNGQAARMQALFASGGARASLLTSGGCGVAGPVCNIPGSRTTSGITASAAVFGWAAVSGVTGYNVRYKTTAATTWTTINTTASSVTVSGLTSCTNYEWQIQTICSTTSSSAYSTSATFQTSGCVATYCASSGGTADEFINRVVLNTINNTSGNNGGYANYTGLSTTLNKGTAYSISLTPGFTSAAYTEVFRVWIDYNGDLDFADAGELVYAPAGSGSAVTGTFTPPTTAITGPTRMRVSMQYNAAPASCGTFTYGEVEDYTVNLAVSSTPPPTSCTDTYESNNTTSTAKTIPVNTNITALIGSSSDLDWFRFSNSSSQKNIRIDLTGLPADYDVRLYNPSGTQVAISQNGGTTAEVITYNNGPVGTYRVRVNGYNGAFSTTACYTLRASLSSTAFREGEVEEEVVAAELNAENNSLNILQAFPNPVNDKLNLRFESTSSQLVNVILIDIAGREVYNSSLSVIEGINAAVIDLMDVTTGYYTLVIGSGEQRAITRIVKK